MKHEFRIHARACATNDMIMQRCMMRIYFLFCVCDDGFMLQKKGGNGGRMKVAWRHTVGNGLYSIQQAYENMFDTLLLLCIFACISQNSRRAALQRFVCTIMWYILRKGTHTFKQKHTLTKTQQNLHQVYWGGGESSVYTS